MPKYEVTASGKTKKYYAASMSVNDSGALILYGSGVYSRTDAGSVAVSYPTLFAWGRNAWEHVEVIQ